MGERNPGLEIAGDPLKEWVHWDSQCDVGSYARLLAGGKWGGGIEIACCSHLKCVNIHVFEPLSRGGFKRIACFNYPSATRTINILYQGACHYEALLLE